MRRITKEGSHSKAKGLNKNDYSDIRIIKEEEHDFSISDVQLDDKEKSGLTAYSKNEKIRKIVVKNGDTLGRIIVKTYGSYNDITLSKVQRQNPEIMDPDLILPGQIIKLPEDKE